MDIAGRVSIGFSATAANKTAQATEETLEECSPSINFKPHI
jgi:hypothetical protein